ncbi:MAG: hypothetical protein ACR2OM_09000, partial [Aestuariivirgaceae bacterium]
MNERQIGESGPDWPEPADRDAFKSARSQSHSAVQWLARLANSYRMPASDASHLHMDWASERGAILTGEIAPGTIVEMRLPELELQFREDGTLTKHVVALDDKSPAEVEAWTLIELLHRGIGRDKYSKDLPYDVSNLLSGDARHYQTLDLEAGFAELTGWLQAAGQILNGLGEQAANGNLGEASAIKFSPAEFTLFMRIHPKGVRPAVGNFVEAGFCAGGDVVEPYFYVSSKPEIERSALPALAAPGQWRDGAS